MTTIIRPLHDADIPAASALIGRVFDRFEGPDYPPEGIDTFHRIIAPDAMLVRLHSGQMQAWGAFRGGGCSEGCEDMGREKEKTSRNENRRSAADNSTSILGAGRAEELVGILAARDKSHISLLFVEETYHRQGIARALFDRFRSVCLADPTIRRITVNSSPYAVGAYTRLGFTPTVTEQVADGIRFTPMEYIIK